MDHIRWTNKKQGGPPSNLTANSNKCNFSYMCTPVPCSKDDSLSEVHLKSSETSRGSYLASNYPFCSTTKKCLNYVSWPSPFNIMTYKDDMSFTTLRFSMAFSLSLSLAWTICTGIQNPILRPSSGAADLPLFNKTDSAKHCDSWKIFQFPSE